MSLPSGDKERKQIPIFDGFMMYFPNAMAAVAKVSLISNEQHNPGEPMHWAKEKSTDQRNTLIRHLIETGTMDSDRIPHDAKVAWRAMANLEIYLESNPWDEAADEIIAANRPIEKAIPGKFDHCPDSTTFNDFPKPEVPEPRKLEAAPERDCIYVVQFRSEANASGLKYVSYEGPFSTLEVAKNHAWANPNNITGIRSIHAINKP